jgi:uncharacterized C2H2 Zn-finger protein
MHACPWCPRTFETRADVRAHVNAEHATCWCKHGLVQESV